MTTTVRPGAGAYWLPGSREYGILLIHGFTGAPPELRMLADYLHDRGGFTVSGIRLSGHNFLPCLCPRFHSPCRASA